MKFEANPTTGYLWYLNYNSNKKYLEAFDLEKNKSSKIYEIPSDQPMLVGLSGFTYFRFRDTRKGKYNLKFIYEQDWELKNDDMNVSLDILIK